MIFIPQRDKMDCAPACLAMVAKFYGKKYDISYLRDISFLSKEGVSLLSISDAAKTIGFDAFSAKLKIDTLYREQLSIVPCILYWDQNHFVVLRKIKRNFWNKKLYFYILDPAFGEMWVDIYSFEKHWLNYEDKGIALFLRPTEDFYKREDNSIKKNKLKYLLKYLTPYPKQIILMFLTLFIGSGISLLFPFLTKELIDKGVILKNLNYITLILLSQLSLFVGMMFIEIIRNWITLYLGTRISISVISEFFKKLLMLPINFFDSKHIGDFNQRIYDNQRIENFLTSQSIVTIFSIVTFFVYFGVLWYYNIQIVGVYIFLTVVSVLWSLFWLKKRKKLDYFRFQQKGENQESIYEIINGVSEMKLNQMEDVKRKEWEKIQEKLFKTNIKILKIDQLQASGYEFINQIKNIIVTFLSAMFVIKEIMTLGELLSVSYIIGQMNSPINQLVGFFRSFQDASLSLERLEEIENYPKEDKEELKEIPLLNEDSGIQFKNVYFQYEGPKSVFVLKNINLFIPNGKITAIVGASGSGKTTLLKLLLKFYIPTK